MIHGKNTNYYWEECLAKQAWKSSFDEKGD